MKGQEQVCSGRGGGGFLKKLNAHTLHNKLHNSRLGSADSGTMVVIRAVTMTRTNGCNIKGPGFRVRISVVKDSLIQPA